jgi:hypothetical protein
MAIRTDRRKTERRQRKKMVVEFGSALSIRPSRTSGAAAAGASAVHAAGWLARIASPM